MPEAPIPQPTTIESVDGHQQLSGSIWHYTDSAGLLGVLQSNALWATSTSMLNDAREIQFGLDIARDIWNSEGAALIDGWIAAMPPGHDPGPISPLAARFIAGVIERVAEDLETNGVFVACASMEPDSLSQWRGYGGVQGYALGLKPKVDLGVLPAIEATPPMKAGIVMPRWRPVIYERSRQEEVVRQTLGFLSVLAPRDGSDFSHPDWNAMYFGAALSLAEAIVSLKHAGFADEREVRMALTYRPLDGYLRFRPTALGITPYLALAARNPDFDSGSIDGVYTMSVRSQGPLPITDVVIGPTPNPTAAENGLRRALEQHGHGTVTISHSEVPYR